MRIQFDSLTRWGYLGSWRIEKGKEHPEGDKSEKGDKKNMIPEAEWSPRGQGQAIHGGEAQIVVHDLEAQGGGDRELTAR